MDSSGKICRLWMNRKIWTFIWRTVTVIIWVVQFLAIKSSCKPLFIDIISAVTFNKSWVPANTFRGWFSTLPPLPLTQNRVILVYTNIALNITQYDDKTMCVCVCVWIFNQSNISFEVLYVFVSSFSVNSFVVITKSSIPFKY